MLSGQLYPNKVRVLVPATSGNLGPGFDCLGLAFQYYDEIEAQVIDGPTAITVEGEGESTLPLDESHLVLRAMRRTFEVLGVPQPNLRLHCVNRIPHGRGMGSSAAAVVGGIMATRELLPDPEMLSKAQMLGLATEFEGHPDNAAPAIYGGATASWVDKGQPYAVSIPVAGELRPVLLVPTTTLATKAARAALPDQVPFHDAVFNVGRTALLVTALGDVTKDLFAATEDKLHQPYRAQVMPESAALVEKLRTGAIPVPAVISGAEPTVLVFATGNSDPADQQLAQEMWQELAKLKGLDLTDWRILPVGVDENGVRAYRELA